jgi:hypothetical protein
MDLSDAIACDVTAFQASAVDPFLDGNMCFRFELQVALAGIMAVIVLQCAFDIDRVSKKRTILLIGLEVM